MTSKFSVVQVEVNNELGTFLLYVKSIENILGMPANIEFCENPWEADRPVLTHDLYSQVYHELNNERDNNVSYARLRNHPNCGCNVQTVQVHRVNVTLEGWDVKAEVSLSSSKLAIQSLGDRASKIVVLNF